MRNMYLKKTFFLLNQVTNKQTSLFYHVLLVLSHQLYSPRGHHIGSISSQTVTICSILSRVEAFNYFSPFFNKTQYLLSLCHQNHLMYFCCCQYQLLSWTFNFLPPFVWEHKNTIGTIKCSNKRYNVYCEFGSFLMQIQLNFLSERS